VKVVKVGNCGASWQLALFMQLAYAAGIARRRHAEQRVAARRKPAIKNWPKFREGPDGHDRRQPLPTGQDANHFNPRKVSFAPAAIGSARVHLLGHLFERVRRGPLPDFRVVVVQPFDAPVAIEGLNPLAYPAAKIAIAVGVDL
jgi:hypothetical protein